MEKITEKFSEFCEEIEFKNLPADVVKRTKLLILDTVGIIIRARHDAESTPSLVSAIEKLELNNGSCNVFSDNKGYTPGGAALLNGSLAHSLDFDDTHAEASLHSSAPILSAALAAAQMKNSSGQDLITACVLGYEIQIRLGLAGGSSAHYKRGISPNCNMWNIWSRSCSWLFDWFEQRAIYFCFWDSFKSIGWFYAISC